MSDSTIHVVPPAPCGRTSAPHKGKEIQMRNIDRFLGISFALLVLYGTYLLFVNFSFSLEWFTMLVFTISLGMWTESGHKKVEIGWKAQLLLFGERLNHKMGEGWHWVPFPFSLKSADCRQTVIKLDKIEKVITADNVQVDVDGSLIRQISDLDKYFDVEESGLKQGLDDIWDETIRNKIAHSVLDDVLKMHMDLARGVIEAMGVTASDSWGLTIMRVVIASIKPDSNVAEDLALKEREELQRDGQVIEIAHFDKMVNALVNGGTINATKPNEVIFKGGMSREQAIEQIQLALGKVTKTIDAKTISFDVATIAAINAFLGRK